MRSAKRMNCAVYFLIIIFLFAGACKSYKKAEEALKDTAYRGTIHISADESFKPIIEAQIQVYEANHRNTKIIVQYKPEAECFKDLAVDSIRMIIATRSFTQDEKTLMVDSLQVSPESLVVARDAISVIANPDEPDSMMTMDDIRDVLKGRFRKNLIPVFDGVKATSTVRFIIDSVLRGDSLTSKAEAARTSEGVIDYVAQNPGVLGFIGVSWVGNPEDTAQISFLKKVRMVSIQSTDNPDWFVKPSQANIYIRRYPMVRDLVYILKENYHGLGHGFADFMSGEIGQLIFRRAYLMPAQKNFGIRPVRLIE
jgi:phosphate transport system substrate-binding protein